MKKLSFKDVEENFVIYQSNNESLKRWNIIFNKNLYPINERFWD